MVAAVYLLRLDSAVGLMVDDAWYVMLGRALAEHRGYVLVNSPFPDILPGYPPGFPALLSLAFRIHHNFPENLWILKSISIVAMAGVGLLSYTHLRDRAVRSDTAALVALAATLTPGLVFLATSTVMSECAFTLGQLATVVVAQRAGERRRANQWHLPVAAGVLAAATVLIRSAGVAVAAAAFLFLLKERLWKQSAVFAVLLCAGLLPWMMYARVNAPTPEQREAHRGSIVYDYGAQLWMKRAGASLSGRIGVSELPTRVLENAGDVVARSIGGIFAAPLLRTPGESGEEVLSLGGSLGVNYVGLGSLPANIGISIVSAAIIALGFFRAVRDRMTPAEILVPLSLGITLLWPWWTFRFILPLTPFLYFYFVRGLSRTASGAVVRVVLLTIVGLNFYDHVGYLAEARSDQPTRADWIARAEEVEGSIRWIDAHIDRSTVIAATNPALLHLRTGHKTITLDSLAEPWHNWRRRGIRYVACLDHHELPDASKGTYRLLYPSSTSPAPAVWVLDIE